MPKVHLDPTHKNLLSEVKLIGPFFTTFGAIAG